MNAVIWWIRRDLRLADNPALAAALERAETVIPLFILDPRLLASPDASPRRTAFLFAGLRALDGSLRQRGSALTVRQGDPVAVLHNLLAETGAAEIFAQADYSPFARARDAQVARELPLSLSTGLTVHPPEAVCKTDGKPYTVYTPFNRLWRSLPFSNSPIPAPARLPAIPPLSQETGIPEPPRQISAGLFPAGEAEAIRRLEAFTAAPIHHYTDGRNRLDKDGTSGLSPYLRFGMLSARQAALAARTALEATSNPSDPHGAGAAGLPGADSWLNELIWREFYLTILYHFPHVRQMAFRPVLRDIHWRNDPSEFAAWAAGRTGYPVVDAAQRQLQQTGWMHNRARMITASFLTKDILIDWRWGERHFMQHLLDGDPAANNGGWQWTAGTGTDAAPYFRVFNPVRQGEKFDPQGIYVRRWVPELAAVPTEFIHTPWKMPADVQRRTGCIIGQDYPAPIVDHTQARLRVLAAYRQGERA